MQFKIGNHISLYLIPEDFYRALLIVGAISICTELIKWTKSGGRERESPRGGAVNQWMALGRTLSLSSPFCLFPLLSLPILMSSPHPHHPRFLDSLVFL